MPYRCRVSNRGRSRRRARMAVRVEWRGREDDPKARRPARTNGGENRADVGVSNHNRNSEKKKGRPGSNFSIRDFLGYPRSRLSDRIHVSAMDRIVLRRTPLPHTRETILNEEVGMHLYWRIQQDLNSMGEAIEFRDPRLARSYSKWLRRNVAGLFPTLEFDLARWIWPSMN